LRPTDNTDAPSGYREAGRVLSIDLVLLKVRPPSGIRQGSDL